MRTFLILSGAIFLMLGLLTAAQAADEAQGIIDKAIQAHGGKEKLAKLEAAAIQMKGKGTVQEAGGLDFTMEITGQAGKFKMVMELDVMGMKLTQTQVFNGDQFWINFNGMDIPLEKDAKDEVKEKVYQEKVGSLGVFLDKAKAKDLELSLLGEAKIDDRLAVGVRVASKGHRDINLYFDKTSGLLLKSEARTIDIRTKQEVTEEKIMRDYKEAEGILRPTKVLMNRDGKKYLEMEFTEIKRVDKLDDSTFAKP